MMGAITSESAALIDRKFNHLVLNLRAFHVPRSWSILAGPRRFFFPGPDGRGII